MNCNKIYYLDSVGDEIHQMNYGLKFKLPLVDA